MEYMKIIIPINIKMYFIGKTSSLNIYILNINNTKTPNMATILPIKFIIFLFFLLLTYINSNMSIYNYNKKSEKITLF